MPATLEVRLDGPCFIDITPGDVLITDMEFTAAETAQAADAAAPASIAA